MDAAIAAADQDKESQAMIDTTFDLSKNGPSNTYNKTQQIKFHQTKALRQAAVQITLVQHATGGAYQAASALLTREDCLRLAKELLDRAMMMKA